MRFYIILISISFLLVACKPPQKDESNCQVFFTTYINHLSSNSSGKKMKHYLYQESLDTCSAHERTYSVDKYLPKNDHFKTSGKIIIIQKGDSVFYRETDLFILNKNVGCYNLENSSYKYCLKQVIDNYKDDFWESEEVWEFWILPQDEVQGNIIKLFYDKKFSLVIREERFEVIPPPPPCCYQTEEYEYKPDTNIVSSIKKTLHKPLAGQSL